MDLLVQALQEVASGALDDVATSMDGSGWEASFAIYRQSLEPALRRYHGSDNALLDPLLRARFQYETALLQIVTHMLGSGLRSQRAGEPKRWPVHQPGNPFSWYRLTPATKQEIVDLAANLPGPNLGVTLAQASGEVLNQAGRRYLGEYHTPLPLVKHLIRVAGCEPTDLLGQVRVVDPACGSGIILVVLANEVVQHGLATNMPVANIVNALANNLHGFDIQPFAVALSQSLLLYTCYSGLGEQGKGVSLNFPNVRLLDPLPETDCFGQTTGGFDYVIGNPPYMRVRQQELDYLPEYELILDGHANLYQLFLWWAVQSVRPGGMVSFLVPQSMLTGSYFEKLRKELDQRGDLLSVTRMIDRKGVVGDADLQMMALSLRVKDGRLYHPPIQVRVTRNGNDIEQAPVAAVPYERVVQRKAGAHIWVVSDHAIDYTIVERLEQSCQRLADLADQFAFGNGGYVWNQHKQLLLSESDGMSLPLVSAASIQPYQVAFPYAGPHPTRLRQFSRRSDEVERFLHSGVALLVQRTTPRKVGRRLIAGLLRDDFCISHPEYFLENHVNYVKGCGESNSVLVGLAGWLNSDLINFVFQLRNGTTLVSVYEMGLLPVSLEMLEQLKPRVEAIMISNAVERMRRDPEIDKLIMDWLELGPKHRRRVHDVLSRKESGRHV